MTQSAPSDESTVISPACAKLSGFGMPAASSIISRTESSLSHRTRTISALSGGPIGLKLQLPREGAILCRRRRVLDSTGRLVQLQTLYYRAERFVCQIDLN